MPIKPINIKVTVRLKGIKMHFWVSYSLGGMEILQDLQFSSAIAWG